MVKLKQLFLSALLLPTLAQAKLPYISGSNNAGVALCKDGNVYSWGSATTALGNTGILNLDKTAPDFVEQSFYSKPQLVATGDVKFKKVVAGSGAMFYGVTESGELYRWGVLNEETIPFSQVMKDGKPLVDVKAVASDTNGFTALMNDGHAVYSYWTTNEHKEKIEVIKDVVLESGELLENIVEVSASDFGFYYVTADGSAYGNGTWNGNNSTSYMELTDYVLPVLDADKNPLKNVKFVEGGNVMAFALMQDGSLYSWGNGGWCQCTGQGVSKTTKNAERVVAGEYSTISGNVYLTNVMQVSAGRAFTLCVTTDGHALYWGCNEGNGGSAPFEGERAGYTPVLLKYADGTVVEDAVAVSTGDNFGFLINKKGEVYSFGLNNSGQCGVGSDKEEVKSLVKMDLPCDLPEYVNVSFNSDTLRLCEGDAIKLDLLSSGSAYRLEWKYNGSVVSDDVKGDVCPYYGDGLYEVEAWTEFGYKTSDVVYVEAVKPAVEVSAVKNIVIKDRESGCKLCFEVSVPDKSDVYFYSDAECKTLVDSMLGVEGKVGLCVPYDKVEVTDGEATIWAVSKKSTVMNVEDVPQLNKIILGSNYFGSFGLIFEVDEPTTIKSFSVFAKGNQNLVESYIKLSPELYSTTISSLGGYTYNKVLFKGEDQKFVLDLDYRECVVDCDVTLQPGVYVMSADLSGANYEYVNVRTNRSFSHSTSYSSPVKDAVIGGVQFIGGVGLSKTPTAVSSDNVPFFNMKFERVLKSQCGAVPVTSEIEYEVPQNLEVVTAEDNDGIVDVYSVSGVLLRKSVEFENALDGLPAGVYMIGNKKVVKTKN